MKAQGLLDMLRALGRGDEPQVKRLMPISGGLGAGYANLDEAKSAPWNQPGPLAARSERNPVLSEQGVHDVERHFHKPVLEVFKVIPLPGIQIVNLPHEPAAFLD